MHIDTWTVAEAKSKFSQLIENARTSGPQTITKNGRTSVVVVSAEEWERKCRRSGSLANFFAESPLANSGLELERVQDEPRPLEL